MGVLSLLLRVLIRVLLLGSRLEDLGRGLGDCSPASHCFDLFDLEFLNRILLIFLTESLVLLVHVQNQFLHVVAGHLVLVKIPRTYAQMQWLVRLFLSWSFFESGAFASESEFNDLLELVVAGSFAADFDDALHVASFGSDESAGHLEFLVILNLDVESASVLDILVRALVLGWLLGLVLTLVLVVTSVGRRVLVNVLVGELGHVGLLGGRELRLLILLTILVVGRLLADVLLVGLGVLLTLVTRTGCEVQPFHLKIRVVLAEVVIIEGLLGEEGGDDVLEGYECESLLGLHSHFPYVTEDLEYLQPLIY